MPNYCRLSEVLVLVPRVTCKNDDIHLFSNNLCRRKISTAFRALLLKLMILFLPKSSKIDQKYKICQANYKKLGFSIVTLCFLFEAVQKTRSLILSGLKALGLAWIFILIIQDCEFFERPQNLWYRSTHSCTNIYILGVILV